AVPINASSFSAGVERRGGEPTSGSAALHVDGRDLRWTGQSPCVKLLRELRDDVPTPGGRRSLEPFRECDFDYVRWAKRWANGVRRLPFSVPPEPDMLEGMSTAGKKATIVSFQREQGFGRVALQDEGELPFDAVVAQPPPEKLVAGTE